MSDYSDIQPPLQALVEGKGDIGPAEALATLDAFLAARRESLPGDLRHYLERRSYQKALAWLRSSGSLPHQP